MLGSIALLEIYLISPTQRVHMLDVTMILTTTFGHGNAHRRCCWCDLSAGRDWKYCSGRPCISQWKSRSCHAIPQLPCSSQLELKKQATTRSLAATPPSIPSSSASTMSWRLSSPVMSALIAVCFALTLLQLPSLVFATSRSGGSFVSYPYQRFRYGSISRRNDFTSRVRNSRRVGAGYIVAPNFGKGRKMLFGTLSCAPQDLSLTQGPVSSTSGIPTFDVQIVNLCGVCAMGQIHVACGNWASATPVDPFVFTRVGYNDCLVNNGAPLSSQGSVSFQYSNSAMYPMSITSASNECP